MIAFSLVALAALGCWWLSALVRELLEPVSRAGNHDFLAFYAAGQMVRLGRATSLYSASVLTHVERQFFPQPTGYQGYLPFLNPPSAAVVLAPLSVLSYGNARLLWLGINLFSGLYSVLIIARGLSPTAKAAVVVVVFASYPGYQALAEGQWSFVLLLFCLLAVQSYQRERHVASGALLAVLWVKPPLVILTVAWLIYRGHWRVLLGLLTSTAVITIATLPVLGVSPFAEYVRYSYSVLLSHASGGGAVVGNAAWEGALPNMEGLLGVSATLVGQSDALLTDVLFAVLSFVAVAAYLVAMRGHRQGRPLRLDLILGAVALGLLLDIHAYAQDCLLLIVALYITLRRREFPWMRRSPSHWSEDSPLIVAVIGLIVLDLSAFDANWIGFGGLKPVHLLALALMCCVAASVVTSKRQHVRSAEVQPGGQPIGQPLTLIDQVASTCSACAGAELQPGPLTTTR